MPADVLSDSLYEEELRVAESAFIFANLKLRRELLDAYCLAAAAKRPVTSADLVQDLCQLWSPESKPPHEQPATAAGTSELDAILTLAELCIEFGRSELSAYLNLLLRTTGQNSRCLDLLLEHVNETLRKILDRKWQLAIGRIEDASGGHIVSAEHWSNVEQDLRRYALEDLHLRIFLTSGPAHTSPVRSKQDPFDSELKRRAAIGRYRLDWNLSTVAMVADDLSVNIKDLHAWARDRSKNRSKIEQDIVKRPGNQLPTQ